MCIGGAEKICREYYGVLPGNKCSAKKQEILEVFRQIQITYVGATDVLRKIHNDVQKSLLVECTQTLDSLTIR